MSPYVRSRSDAKVQEPFNPWRPITERERELLHRAMQRAARELLTEWDKRDGLAGSE